MYSTKIAKIVDSICLLAAICCPIAVIVFDESLYELLVLFGMITFWGLVMRPMLFPKEEVHG